MRFPRIRIPALGIRLLTVAVAVPSYVFLMWVGETFWIAAVVWSAIIAGYEYFNLMEKGGYPTNSKLGMVWIAILIIRYSGAFDNIPFSVVVTWGMVVLLASALFSRRTPFLTWLSTAGGAMYIGSSMALLIPIRQHESGFWWLFFLMFSTYMADAGAYLVGSLWGKHKMWPDISPKKSWEGLIGSVTVGPLSGLTVILASYQPGWDRALIALSQTPFLSWTGIQTVTSLDPFFFSPMPINLWTGWALAMAISLLGQLGDLTISMWKRHVGAKDSGTFFRGHGGMLDRLDSLLFTAPLVYSFILLL